MYKFVSLNIKLNTTIGIIYNIKVVTNNLLTLLVKTKGFFVCSNFEFLKLLNS